MKSDSLVSIIVPCYNGSRFIKETIISVLNQTHSNFELIIVNDGSTDDSVEMISQIEDNRIRLINKENSGVSESRNFGLTNSKGNFIIFLDADDLLQAGFLEKSVKIFTENPEIDFLTLKIKQIDEDSKEIKIQNNLRGTYKNVQFEIASFLPEISTCPSAYIYRKSKIIENNITFNSALSSPADRFYLLQVGASLKGGFIPNCELKYRLHANSMSQLKNKKLIVDQENYLEATLKNEVIILKQNVLIFKRKLNYQLFIDYLKMLHLPKTLKYGWNYMLCFF